VFVEKYQIDIYPKLTFDMQCAMLFYHDVEACKEMSRSAAHLAISDRVLYRPRDGYRSDIGLSV
jgi:hypothetical protein